MRPKTCRAAAEAPQDRPQISSKITIALLLAFSFLASSCVDREEASPSISSETTEAPISSADTAPATSRIPTESEAETLRLMAQNLTQLSPRGKTFLDSQSDTAISKLATEACTLKAGSAKQVLTPEVAQQQYTKLPKSDQAKLSESEWAGVFGLVINFYCPGDVAAEDPDAPSFDTNQDFREQLAVADEEGSTAELMSLLTDERLQELSERICIRVNAQLSSQDLGSAILASKQGDLGEPERAAVSTSGYAKFFGSVIGHYCPERRPNTS